MNVSKINPHIRFAVRHEGVFRVRRTISVCYDARLFYFVNTSGSITINGDKYEISNKKAVYLPPLSRYIFNLKADKDSEVCIIDFDLVTDYEDIKHSLGTASVSDFDPRKAPVYDLPSEFSVPIVRTVSKISGLLYGAVENFSKHADYTSERASAMIKLVLLDLIDSTDTVKSPMCTKILRCIEENYQDPLLTNELIAEKLNYHPYYVNRVFKREMGEALRSYIINYRLSVARDLLLHGEESISEIAYRTGFSSSSYFVKTFRQRIGTTPKEYRNTRSKLEL